MGCLAVIGGLAVLPVIFVATLVLTHSATAGVVATMVVPLCAAVAVALNQRSRRALAASGAGEGADDEDHGDDEAGDDPPPVAPEAAWEAARERFAGVRAEYSRVECDPLEVLRLPALTDVSVPSTARFVDAFAAAQALLTDRYPGAPIGEAFTEAADGAERAWRAAVDAAERIRLQGIDPAERAAVERVVKLLTTARDSDNEPERRLAHARARAELGRLDAAGVVHVPMPAQAALDAAARRALPP
ncbi:hypothetical protein [Pseudonocardia lacus]|uniref:hypothetical protein n=1 Tax=Pseudonocardia lacus TaxID=2835865 RepID=UPI001BDC826A|nr:hypothetical protein [Pseudonocardia lacus]